MAVFSQFVFPAWVLLYKIRLYAPLATTLKIIKIIRAGKKETIKLMHKISENRLILGGAAILAIIVNIQNKLNPEFKTSLPLLNIKLRELEIL